MVHLSYKTWRIVFLKAFERVLNLRTCGLVVSPCLVFMSEDCFIGAVVSRLTSCSCVRITSLLDALQLADSIGKYCAYKLILKLCLWFMIASSYIQHKVSTWCWRQMVDMYTDEPASVWFLHRWCGPIVYWCRRMDNHKSNGNSYYD